MIPTTVWLLVSTNICRGHLVTTGMRSERDMVGRWARSGPTAWGERILFRW
jgi:hypothetical protein